MKCVAVIVVVVQLIARGASVPHCHVHPDQPEHPDHGSRPHFHLKAHKGHSHSAHNGPKHHAHAHPHHHHEQAPGQDSAEVDSAELPSPHSQDHDEDSVYVNDDPLTVATARSEFTQASDVTWCRNTRDPGRATTHSGRQECCAWELPDRYAEILFTLLGHVLRV